MRFSICGLLSLYLKIDGDIKHFNSCVDELESDKFPNISVSFEGEKMVDYILKIPRLLYFSLLNVLTVILQNYIFEIIPP